MSQLTVTTPSDREIVLRRVFQAPRPLVFRALTEPDLLRRWFGARGWQLVGCEVDLRVGGRWRFVSHGPGGAELGHGGVYRVVEPPERLVHTELFDGQSYPGESLVSHRLTELSGDTTLTTTVRYATREGRDTVLRYPMARGVAEGYYRLAALLNGDAP
jgi:uncharacterized protein YndB with AHSA1/START domain